jgi:hypothetical protein
MPDIQTSGQVLFSLDQPLRTVVSVPIYVTGASGTPTVWLEYSLAGTNEWESPPQQAIPATQVTGNLWSVQLDPSSLSLTNPTPESPNGPYDFRAVAIDGASQGTSATSTATVAINAAYLSLHPTGSPLSGPETLTADV